MLVMGVALAMVPAMMFPILKRQNEALAIGYVIFRGALESLTYIALAMCWLLLGRSGPAVCRLRGCSRFPVFQSRDSVDQSTGSNPCSPGHRLRPRRPDVLLPVVSSETHSAMAIRLGDCWGHGCIWPRA